MLKVICKRFQLADNFNYQMLANITCRLVDRDLPALVILAGEEAIKRFDAVPQISTQAQDQPMPDKVVPIFNNPADVNLYLLKYP